MNRKKVDAVILAAGLALLATPSLPQGPQSRPEPRSG